MCVCVYIYIYIYTHMYYRDMDQAYHIISYKQSGTQVFPNSHCKVR